MEKNDKTQEIIDKLKEDLLNYEIFFNNSNDGFIIHREGEIIVINEAALNIIGLKKHEISQYNLFDFITDDYKKIVREKINQKYEGYYEIIGVRKDGKKIDVLLNTKEITYRNKPARTVFIRDITEEKKKLQDAQEQTKKIENQRKSLVSMAKLSTKVKQDYESVIKTIIEITTIILNSKIGGFWEITDDKKYLVPRGFIGEMDSDLKIKYNDVIQKNLENRIFELNNDSEIKNTFSFLKDSKEKLNLIISPVRFEEEIIGIICIGREKNYDWQQYEKDFVASVSDIITLVFERWNRNWIEQELEESLEELKKLNRIKSDFISMISHELRTPMTSILAYLKVLLKGDIGKLSPEQLDFLKIIEKNSMRLLDLINQLLDISKIETGKFAVEKQKVNLIDLTNNVVTEMMVLSDLKRIKIIKEFLYDKIIITGDNNRLSQVITNIIHNAIKFSENNGEINIKLQIISDKELKIPDDFKFYDIKNEKYVLISIKDYGSGIEKENLKNIFSMFYQVEKIDTRKHGGIGLGLYIAQEIVKQHNGLIWAESEGAGKGTTFNILLPMQ